MVVEGGGKGEVESEIIAPQQLALQTKFDKIKCYKKKGLAKSDSFRKMTRQ